MQGQGQERELDSDLVTSKSSRQGLRSRNAIRDLDSESESTSP